MHDFIEPMIGLPLAVILCAVWWLVERRGAERRQR